MSVYSVPKDDECSECGRDKIEGDEDDDSSKLRVEGDSSTSSLASIRAKKSQQQQQQQQQQNDRLAKADAEMPLIPKRSHDQYDEASCECEKYANAEGGLLQVDSGRGCLNCSLLCCNSSNNKKMASFSSIPPSPPSSTSLPRKPNRPLGLLCAVFTGVWGGSMMVPMHYAPSECRGTGFVFSFSVGAFVVNAAMIAIWKLIFRKKLNFHFKKAWKHGMMAGFLWGIGNIGSIITVQILGEAVGFSIIQSNLIISGAWGIFYYGEVRGTQRCYWLASAMISTAGMIGLVLFK